jgi:hypothetical protein
LAEEQDLGLERLKGGSRSGSFGDDHDVAVQRKVRLALTKDVPQAALDEVAGDRLPDLAADSEAEARPRLRSPVRDENHQLAMAAVAPALNGLEVFRLRDALAPTEPLADAERGVRARRVGGARGGAGVRRVQGVPRSLVKMVGVSCLRPFLRRRWRTSRPPGVAIRARKPWTRLRRILLGWNVRFMGRGLYMKRIMD